MGTERLPTPGLFVTDDLKTLFVEVLDQLIADVGRPVKLFLEPIASGCPNCGIDPDGNSNSIYNTSNPFGLGQYNKPFPDLTQCPVCIGTHNILTENSVTWTASIGRETKDSEFFPTGFDPANVYRTKMVIEAFEDIRNTKKALIDGEVCVRIRDPVKTGLKDLKYVRCWWKKQD